MKRFALFLLIVAAGCRDGAAPFTPIGASGDSSTNGRLTWNVRGDHTPAFRTSASDSVYFAAATYPNLPPTNGMLLGISRNGGTVKPMLPALQVGATRTPWLTAPAFSADGSRIAFFEITDYRDKFFDYIVCPIPPMTPSKDTLGSNSFLQEAVLRVRKVNGTSDDGQLTVKFPGAWTFDSFGNISNIAYPFQRLFEAEGVPFMRASWSPDGTRVVFSDGGQLRLWTVGASTSTVIVGTEDGILPAWSPDGTWIAFSKPFKGVTQSASCQGWYNNAVKPAGLFGRTIYTPLTRESAQLFIVHADGTGLKSLGVGEAPAWTADSKTIVAHRDNNLVRIDAASGTGTVINSTLDAFEPAISLDGKYLTFARRVEVGAGAAEPNSRGQYNIWVAPF